MNPQFYFILSIFHLRQMFLIAEIPVPEGRIEEITALDGNATCLRVAHDSIPSVMGRHLRPGRRSATRQLPSTQEYSEEPFYVLRLLPSPSYSLLPVGPVIVKYPSVRSYSLLPVYPSVPIIQPLPGGDLLPQIQGPCGRPAEKEVRESLSNVPPPQ